MPCKLIIQPVSYSLLACVWQGFLYSAASARPLGAIAEVVAAWGPMLDGLRVVHHRKRKKGAAAGTKSNLSHPGSLGLTDQKLMGDVRPRGPFTLCLPKIYIFSDTTATKIFGSKIESDRSPLHRSRSKSLPPPSLPRCLRKPRGSQAAVAGGRGGGGFFH